jgi:hypothetical protein
MTGGWAPVGAPLTGHTGSVTGLAACRCRMGHPAGLRRLRRAQDQMQARQVGVRPLLPTCAPERWAAGDSSGGPTHYGQQRPQNLKGYLTASRVRMQYCDHRYYGY